jgi:tRNA uridine 5-carboxymethylaminomethyl modification enzyme
VIENTPNLYMWQDSVDQFIIEGGVVKGVKTVLGMQFNAQAVVLTAGTFLNGLMHVGPVQTPGGRVSEPPARGITEQLAALGLTVGRMKTGTPPRLDERTIDFTQCIKQEGEQDFHHFSFMPGITSSLPQRPCWIVHTNEDVHAVLREGLPQSPLYNGQITSIGPRYCPSIETKIVTFADKTSHQLFIEPEGATTHEMYLNGFSSSLPWPIQIEALRHIPALRDVHAFRPGYAIEYDFFDPTQLYHTLESKVVKNLFLAGQVNGTTGYEEAAGQGLIAGINAHQRVTGGEPFTLARNEAYIGVLIDDLVTRGVDEPYRMFTSRAEHRILLRQDDADMRLTEKGYRLGLATQERYGLMLAKREQIEALTTFCREFTVKAAVINPTLEALGMNALTQGQRLHDLLLRPQLNMAILAQALPELQDQIDRLEEARRQEIVEAAEIAIKYRGYIERETSIAERVARLDNVTLKGKFDYTQIHQISTEARQKLQAIDPETVGQASRIPGVSPSDINILLVLLGR